MLLIEDQLGLRAQAICAFDGIKMGRGPREEREGGGVTEEIKGVDIFPTNFRIKPNMCPK